MTPERYIKTSAVVAFAYWLLSMFVGSRPAFPFVPYGAAAITVLALGVGAAYVAIRMERYMKPAFRILTVCCLVYGAFLIAEVFAHLSTEDGYYLRPLLTLPLIGFIWYGIWKWLFLWNTKSQ